METSTSLSWDSLVTNLAFSHLVGALKILKHEGADFWPGAFLLQVKLLYSNVESKRVIEVLYIEGILRYFYTSMYDLV